MTGPSPPAARPSGPGRPPDPARRDAAIAAAQALFLAQGFERTSMAAIARAAGVAKPTLYAWFGDKAQLFAAAVTRKCETVLGSFELSSSGGPPDALLTAAARRFLDLVLDPEALNTHRLVTMERERHPELGQLFLVHAIAFTKARFTALIAALAAHGLAIDDPEQTASDLLGLLRGWPVLMWELSGPSMSPDELDAHAARCVAVVLAGHRPARTTDA